MVETAMQLLGEGLIILAMLALNAIFAAYEMALASISHARLDALLQLGRRGARSAVWMKTRIERSLAVVQVGITLAGAIAAATGGVGVDKHLAPLLVDLGLARSTAEFLALALFVLPLSALTITFAELVPKMFALHNKERVALTLSPVLKVVSMIFYPAIFILETTVKRVLRLGWPREKTAAELQAEQKAGLLELRAAASLARAERLIGAMEEKIVTSAVQFPLRTVREVMLPAAEIAMIHESASLMEALLFAHQYMHTRYPTCTEPGNPQSIGGYVNFKDITSTLRVNPAAPSLKCIIRPLPKFGEQTSLAQALEQMMREKVHIAAVTTAGGEILGVITLEDIVGELVGQIGDEYDRLPVHIHPLESGWIIGGGVALATVAKTTGLPVPAEPAAKPPATLAEWFAAQKHGPLHHDDVHRLGDFEVRVRKIKRHKVMEVLLTRNA
jgi:putative hemolysin